MTFFITPFHYTDCFSVRQIGYGGSSYYETIARGYADAGFDTGVLNEAVQESVRRMLDEMDPEEELNETWQMML